MAKGRVKDPAGHQSGPYDFGYIQRIATNMKERNKLKWPDNSEQTKSIPFLNKKKIGGKTPIFTVKNIGKDVEFMVLEAVIYLEKTKGGKKRKKQIKLGTIGIALLDEQINKNKRKKKS